MTPKQKCKELIINFSPLFTIWDCRNDAPESDEEILADAKKCALVCIDEIQKLLSEFNPEDMKVKWQKLYYTDVKKEIEKL